jgi:hypothetical protein
MAQAGDGLAAAGRGHQRASHADREHVIGMLEAAFAAGLLSKDELDLGVDRALAARTHADLAAATVGLPAPPTVARSAGQPAKPFTRPENAVWGVCGLIVTAFLTIVIVPSGATRGVVVVTAGAVYAAFWLLAGIAVLALHLGWLRLPARHRPHDQVRLGAAGDGVRQRRLGRFVG